MHISHNPDEIQTLKDHRSEHIISLPDEWRDSGIALAYHKNRTTTQPVALKGRSVFGNRPVRIDMCEAGDTVPRLLFRGESVPMTAEQASEGFHSIKIGEVQYIEHLLALLHAFRLDVDVGVSESSLPLYPDGLQQYIKEIMPHVQPLGDTKYCTVWEPVACVFNPESYMILEPDGGDNQLIFDHQISYPNTPLKTQRTIVEMTPELFSFIADARSPAFALRTKLARVLHGIGFQHLPHTSFSMDNIVFVGEEKILNPNDKYNLNGTNLEPLVHGIIDKMGWLPLVENMIGRRFAGIVTSFFMSHGRDIEVAKAITREEIALTMT